MNNRLNIVLLQSDDYKRLLIETFGLSGCFYSCSSLNSVLENEFLNFYLLEIKNSSNVERIKVFNEMIESYRAISWLYIIDDVYIGVYKNQYMVSYNESELDFEYNGNTESNWMPHTFGWAVEANLAFQQRCLELFNIPISTFDPYAERDC